MEELYGTDAMGMTAENLAEMYSISREDQDKFAVWSQEKAAQAQKNGILAKEIVPVHIPRKKQEIMQICKISIYSLLTLTKSTRTPTFSAIRAI